MNINEICNKMCDELPEDYQIIITLEKGSGWVDLSDSNDEQFTIEIDDSIENSIKEALRIAIGEK